MAGFWDTGGGEDFGATSSWDRMTLADWPLPGRVTVEGAKSWRVDTRNAPGTDGAKMTNLGLDSSEITVRLQMWTQKQLDDWSVVSKVLWPRSGKSKPKPLAVYHPGLALYGIDSLYPVSVGVPRVERGIAEVQIKFLQYLPPNMRGVMPARKPIDTGVANALAPKASAPANAPPSAKGAGPGTGGSF